MDFLSPTTPFVALLVYLLVLLLVRYLYPPLPTSSTSSTTLSSLLALHNTILFLISIYLFYGLLSSSSSALVSSPSLSSLLCADPTHARTMHDVWHFTYLFYVSKYYELVDTIFLALRRRQLSTLHLFHHAAVVPLFQRLYLIGATNVWLVALLNTLVHIPMYAYFALSAVPAPLVQLYGQVVPRPVQDVLQLLHPKRYKRWLTTLQITQFYVDLVIILAMDILLPECRDRIYLLVQTDGVLAVVQIVSAFIVPVALIALFQRFYRNTYKRD